MEYLIRQRSYPIAVTGDLKKAFLQVRIKEQDRKPLRFHWRKDENSELETLRFTRALFGLTCSPFLLGGVIEYFLGTWEPKKPELVPELRKNLYVDDLLAPREGRQYSKRSIARNKPLKFLKMQVLLYTSGIRMSQHWKERKKAARVKIQN